MKLSLFLLASLCLSLSNAAWQVDPPFYGQQYASINTARGLFVDPAGDLLVISRASQGQVICIFEEQNGDGTITVRQQTLISSTNTGLNHGLTFNQGYIYASSATAVYRWPYTPGSRTAVNVAAETVINGIPNGGHNTRTLVFDLQNRLYVSVGSNANVDNNSDRARIRRFNIAGLFPIPFNTGEVFADGLRNEVGLAWDLDDVLCGVENGADQLNRADIGGDIHNGNPAEEFNRFNRPAGSHYGYPYCFSTHNLQGQAKGTQYAWPTFMNDGVHNDAWCRNVANNGPPLIAMPAHQAPLGMDFYRGQNCSAGQGAFPCDMRGDAVVAFHGSWNSDTPVGYGVWWYPFSAPGTPTGEEKVILYGNPVTSVRPANVVFNNKGHMFVSADSNNIVVKVTHGTPPPVIKSYIVNGVEQ